MKTAGIIAEYNPFHNGHQYQMETVRHLTGADFVIVAMSGDFMQRGVPAIADKYTRTEIRFLPHEAMRCAPCCLPFLLMRFLLFWHLRTIFWP